MGLAYPSFATWRLKQNGERLGGYDSERQNSRQPIQYGNQEDPTRSCVVWLTGNWLFLELFEFFPERLKLSLHLLDHGMIFSVLASQSFQLRLQFGAF